MKLLVSLLASVSMGCLVYGLFQMSETTTRPDPDFITKSLRRGIQKLLDRKIPFVARYVDKISPMLEEITLPPSLDFHLFLALHLIIGIPLWFVMAYAFPGAAIFLLPLCIVAGAFLPHLWLKSKQAKFHTALLKSMPDCLDLQALVMEAGLDLNAGLQHYLEKGTSSPLQGLLRGVQKEIQMGRSRADAFSNLANKTSYYPLRDVCRGIVQAITLGTSLAPLMREQAKALRIKRMQIAEKKAAEAPLKILFPLFVFIFPTIFIILLGPMAVTFMQGGF